MAFKLPRLKANFAIVDGQGKPVTSFLQLFNVEFAARIEANEAAQNQALEDLNALLLATQAAQQAAQAAQQTANGGSGGTGNEGSNTGTIDPIPAWSPVATVNLTGVVAGNLTIPGSGPIQSDNVERPGKGSSSGQFRIVEVVGMVDTVLFVGNYSVYSSGDDGGTVVSNTSASDVFAFTSARTSTGSITYRLDVNQLAGVPIINLDGYLYVRRS